MVRQVERDAGVALPEQEQERLVVGDRDLRADRFEGDPILIKVDLREGVEANHAALRGVHKPVDGVKHGRGPGTGKSTRRRGRRYSAFAPDFLQATETRLGLTTRRTCGFCRRMGMKSDSLDTRAGAKNVS